jgi:hypothetical protein
LTTAEKPLQASTKMKKINTILQKGNTRKEKNYFDLNS